jgi:preprotein translocase SecE subunit
LNVAKNMTARKKNTGRAATARRTATPQSIKARQTEKSGKVSADGKADQSVQASTDEKVENSAKASIDRKTEKSVKSFTDGKAEKQLKAAISEKTDKALKAAARGTTRREPTKQESKTAVRRDAKGPSNLVKRLRNNSIGRFLYEAYYELLHKVTWPTFREARNMTAVVIVVSAVIGLILFAADVGLHRLFLFIIGAQ